MASPNGLPNGITGSKPLTPAAQIPTKVRKDGLSHVTVNQLFENTLWVQQQFLTEHRTDGYHNALEVAREVGVITYAAGAYAVAAQSPRALITAVAKQAVGQCRVTFNALAFKTGDLRDDACFSLSATGIGLESKPMVVQYSVVDATTIDVFVWQLSSALGGANNNTWALVDDGFTLGVYGMPTTASISNTPDFAPHQRGNNLAVELATTKSWNSIAKFQGQIRKWFLTSHDAAGAHATQEVAKGQAHVNFSGGTYHYVENSGLFTGLSRPGAGIVQMTFPARSTAVFEVFGEVDYARANGGASTDIYLIGFPKSQYLTTQVRAYIFKYDAGANSWSLADTDLYVSVHSA